MRNKAIIHLDFEVDKLTNSIENAISGEVFDTLVIRIKTKDARQIRKGDWTFNWQNELKDTAKQVYKLTTLSNPNIIQGLISLTNKGDHIFMDLIEAQNSIKERINCIRVLLVILLPLPVKWLLNQDMMKLFPLYQRPSLSVIMNKRWVQNYLVEIVCLSIVKRRLF